MQSKIPSLITQLMAYQYNWIKSNRVGTYADPDIVLPAGISDHTKGKVVYKKPDRLQFRLDTPAELFFEGIGQQAGQGVAAFISYKGRLAAFEKALQETRKAYFACYPDCSDMQQLNGKLSRLLIEKDLHYLKLAGNYNLLSDRLDRGLAALNKLTGANNKGGSLLDGGDTLSMSW